MTDLQNTLNNVLLNKELTAIEFYTINDKYWVFDEEKVWVVDCGVQLTFNEYIFTFAWNSEKQFYEHHLGKIEEITGDHEITPLHANEVESIQKLIGNKITEVKYKWNFYHDLDENYEPMEQKNYMPMEMILSFENGSVLQLAAVNFKVDTVNKTIGSATFDSTGNFLITLNHLISVKEEEESISDEELI
ncbi:MAG: hypothetical protein K0S44_2145 [Bacteroidetes bacterium]|jgi:hypothetical protein|nr:hypothetical protein [Bacteroidota bacterium]